MKNLWKSFTNKFFGDHLDFRARLFNIIGFAFVAICSLGGLSNYFLVHLGIASMFIGMFGAVFTLFVMWYVRRTGRYTAGYIATIIVLFLGVIPCIFFTCGGYKSSMPVYFTLFVLFTVIMLSGRLRIFFVVLEVCVYSAICVYAYYVPHSVIQFASESDILIDIIVGLVLACSSLGVTMAMHFNRYDRQLTEFKEARDAAERARKATEEYEVKKSEFFAKMSHEFRTPLSVMATGAQMVGEHIDNNDVTDSTRSYLRYIYNESMRLADMAGCTLTALTTPFESIGEETLKDEYEFAPVHIGDFISIISGIVKPSAKKVNVRLTVDIEEDMPPIKGDSDALIQLMLNLLHNVVKHAGAKNVKVSAKKVETNIVLIIEDDGNGIPPNLLPKVFDQGVSGKPGGTGLGLYVCRNIVQAHNGDIIIENMNDGGTRVTVTFPIDS